MRVPLTKLKKGGCKLYEFHENLMNSNGKFLKFLLTSPYIIFRYNRTACALRLSHFPTQLKVAVQNDDIRGIEDMYVHYINGRVQLIWR